ncbi:MAG: hypothetical protein J7L93_02700, partial [Thermoplasmata archaeon]|nr:hypothetical protein [Thermoplasmata archaeon]
NDFIIPLESSCDCGIHTHLLGIVGGRKVDSIVLEDGRIIPPSSITGIPGKVMHELGTDKIQQFQIIQKSMNLVEIHLVIDEKLRNVGPSVKDISERLREKYRHKFGDEVEVVVREVDEIRKSENVDTPPHVVISEVKIS